MTRRSDGAGNGEGFLVIGSRDASKSEEVVQAIRWASGKAFFQATDVSRPAEVKALGRREHQGRVLLHESTRSNSSNMGQGLLGNGLD